MSSPLDEELTELWDKIEVSRLGFYFITILGQIKPYFADFFNQLNRLKTSYQGFGCLRNDTIISTYLGKILYFRLFLLQHMANMNGSFFLSARLCSVYIAYVNGSNCLAKLWYGNVQAVHGFFLA